MSVRYAAGLGARRGADAQAIVDLVRDVATRHNAPLSQLTLFTLESKVDEAGLHEAAKSLGGIAWHILIGKEACQ